LPRSKMAVELQGPSFGSSYHHTTPPPPPPNRAFLHSKDRKKNLPFNTFADPVTPKLNYPFFSKTRGSALDLRLPEEKVMEREWPTALNVSH